MTVLELAREIEPFEGDIFRLALERGSLREATKAFGYRTLQRSRADGGSP